MRIESQISRIGARSLPSKYCVLALISRRRFDYWINDKGRRLINCLVVTQSKVDATTKKTKAPAATAGVENLGPAFGK